MKTPQQTAEAGSEHAHQVAFFQWCAVAYQYGIWVAAQDVAYTVAGEALRLSKLQGSALCNHPGFQWIHAVSNHGAGYGRAAEGVRAGVSDIFNPYPMNYGGVLPIYGLYMEMKKPAVKQTRNGGLQPDQIRFLNEMRERGYWAATCYSWKDARDELLTYLKIYEWPSFRLYYPDYEYRNPQGY